MIKGINVPILQFLRKGVDEDGNGSSGLRAVHVVSLDALAQLGDYALGIPSVVLADRPKVS